MCHMQEANWFFKMPKTWCPYKDLHIHWQLDPLYVCVCIHTVMSHGSVTCYCILLCLWCWQAERGYGIGVETAVFQNTAGAVSLFCSILLIFLDTMCAVLIAISTNEQLKKNQSWNPAQLKVLIFSTTGSGTFMRSEFSLHPNQKKNNQ